MCKIMLEVEYFIKIIIYHMLKFFKRIAYFIPRWFDFLKQKKLIFSFLLTVTKENKPIAVKESRF